MECNEMSVCSGDGVLLCYSNLIDFNCEKVQKVAVNYVASIEMIIYRQIIQKREIYEL